MPASYNREGWIQGAVAIFGLFLIFAALFLYTIKFRCENLAEVRTIIDPSEDKDAIYRECTVRRFQIIFGK